MHTEYSQLIALTKKYLLEEFDRKDWIATDAPTYQYFKQLALQKKQAEKQALPKPVEAPRPNPPTPIYVAPKPVVIVEEKVEPPKLEVPKPKAEPVNPKDQKLALDPMPPAGPHDLSDIRKIVAEKMPHISILDMIPCNEPEIAIVLSEVLGNQTFIKNLARALHLTLGPTIIAPLAKLESMKKLRLQITHASSHAKADVPSLVLSDIGIYLREPQQKAQLWQQIRQLMK